VSGASAAFEVFEPSFHQDLNGDGVIGIITTTIEAFGSTRLAQGGGQFFLFDSGGTGPVLKINGAAATAVQLGSWLPIGAEQTASGYEVAWRNGGADQYTMWNTDTNGNYSSSPVGVVSGASAAFEVFEPSFHQDLNGDGVIGAVGIAGPMAERVVRTGDFDGDGQPEILWQDADDLPKIAEMSGSSVISTVALPAVPPSWRLVSTADIDGDGRSDIRWQNSDGQVALWQMSGSSIASAVSLGNPGSAWQLQGAGDLNGDGHNDLLFLNPLTHQTKDWLMNGSQVASVQAPVSAAVAAPPSATALPKTEISYSVGTVTLGGGTDPIGVSTPDIVGKMPLFACT
jgi:hypothetical protein